jgi:flavin-dependent dehydrogenase
MMQRPVFDHILAERAVRAGAKLQDGIAVRSLEVEGDRVCVRAQVTKTGNTGIKGEDVVATARYVIGADGANGVTAKAANLRPHPAIALAMEIELPHRWGDGHADLRPDVAHLEYGAVQRGYAWVFPKADHLNIGAGLFRPHRNNDARGNHHLRGELRKTIFDYMNALQLRYEPDHLQFFAHPLPIWNGKEPVNTPDGKILLAGDAAGLINPFFGDGILHAVKSGMIAATCVAEGTTQTYSDRIHAEFAANFDAALNLAQFFYKYPGVCYKAGVKSERSTRTAARLLSGDLQFNDITGRVMTRLRNAMVGNSSAKNR